MKQGFSLEFDSDIVFRTTLQSKESFLVRDPVDDISDLQLYTANSQLFKLIQRTEISNKDSRKKSQTLYNYRARACFRCTPYGLYAGTGVASWGESSEIILSDKINPNTRLSYAILSQLRDKIVPLIQDLKTSCFFTNTSLGIQNSIVNYIARFVEGSEERFNISSVESNIFLETIVDACINGKTFRQIIDVVTKIDASVSIDQVTAYINLLINEQILVNEYEIALNVKDYQSFFESQFYHLAKRLIRHWNALSANILQ